MRKTAAAAAAADARIFALEAQMQEREHNTDSQMRECQQQVRNKMWWHLGQESLWDDGG